VVRTLWRKPTFLHLCAGITLVSFVGYGNTGFTHPYFVRRFQLGYAEAAIIFGVISGLSAAVGTLAGGFVTDRLARRDKRWYVWTPAIGLSIAAVISMVAFMQDRWVATALLLTLPGIFSYTYLAPTFALTHNMVEPRMRATATAVLFFVLNLIALGFGPVFVGLLSDLYASREFTAGAFATLCPGGVAAANAAGGLETACREASAIGLRNAIMTTLLILFWGSLHYLLAARTLERDLQSR
jgi:MFS family permease